MQANNRKGMGIRKFGDTHLISFDNAHRSSEMRWVSPNFRFIWLHGFASGPSSSKGQFVRARLEERGLHLVIPDLNEPSFFDLTVSRMLEQLDVLAQGDDPV